MLSEVQVAQFHRDGYLVFERAIPAGQLARLRDEFEQWKEESRAHGEAYGETEDHRARFDVEPGHSAEHPALRRVASPVEISDSYLEVMRASIAVDAVAQLIGPNVEFNNSKINSKQPGAATQVRYHQDFLFQPHTNDDLIAVLFFLDDVTLENGPLEVVPGSHHGPLHEHWQDGVFTGALSADEAARAQAQTVACAGPAGTACLMHNRVVHGSAPNLSTAPRTLFICEYRAEDSYPLQVNHLPSIFTGEIVRGERTNRVRCTNYEMQFPEVPTGASFFEQQAQQG